MNAGALRGRVILGALVVVLVSVLIYIPGLGRNGLRSTEGHRTIPGWHILETGEWLPTRMFEAVYVRKPPGMPWAICLSSMALGETEFAARLPSAIGSVLGALLVFLFAWRWFGSLGGAVASGLAQALAPGLWAPGRSAEIETLNNLATALFALGAIELLVFQRARATLEGVAARTSARAIGALAVAVGLFGFALMKGPASLPVALGVLLACAIVSGMKSTLRSGWAWGGLGLGLVCIATLGWFVLHAMGDAAATLSGSDAAAASVGASAPEAEGVGDKLFWWHLWRESDIGEILALAPLTFAGALPGALALLFPFGPDARGEAATGPSLVRLRVARALAIGFLLSTAIYLVVGVSNPRYTMPAVVLAAPAVGYVWRSLRDGMTPARQGIARVMMLGHPVVLLTVLVGAAVWWVIVAEPKRGLDSGREAGAQIGQWLPDGAEIWADELIESRPETLLYAQLEAAKEGRSIRPVWKPGLRGQWTNGMYIAVVRSGGMAAGEEQRVREAPGWSVEEIGLVRVHLYDTAVLRLSVAPE